MKVENSSSAGTSAKTSSSGHSTPRATESATITEAQFLDAQAEKAKAALAATFADLKKSLGQGLSPLKVAKEHPWVSLGAGLVAGFAAASALVPSKEQQALNHLRRIEAALHRPPAGEAGHEHKGSDGVAHEGFSTMLIKQFIGLIRPVIASLISSLLAGQNGAVQPQAPVPADNPDTDVSGTST